MKKIKYLIFILPLLFITNVNAECVNLINFNNISNSNTNISNATYSVNSLDSITFNFVESISYGQYKIYLNIPVVADSQYIYSYDYSVVSNNNVDLTYYSDFISPRSSLSTLENNFTYPNGFRKYQTSFSSSNISSGLFIYFDFPRNINSITFTNFKMYLESQYDSCINGGSTPTPITYTYTFKVDNEVYSTGTVEEGTNITLPETNPTKEGYTFTGWTLNGESYTGGEIHSNIEIIANFTENQVEPSPEPETPQETSEIDVSGLIPYLLLIASLVMLFIEINFIKSLLKSRR